MKLIYFHVQLRWLPGLGQDYQDNQWISMTPALQQNLFLALGFAFSLFSYRFSLPYTGTNGDHNFQTSWINGKKSSLQVYIVIDISLLLQDKLQQTMQETAQSVTQSLQWLYEELDHFTHKSFS